MAVDSRGVQELHGRHFDRKVGMERDEERPQVQEQGGGPPSGGLSSEERDMRNAGRRLEMQEDGSNVIGAVRRLEEAVRQQEENNRQLAKDVGSFLQEMRQLVCEVERIRVDAQDESHTARQAALSGVNRAQQEAEQLTIRNIEKVTKKSEQYIDSMVQLARRRIERLALVTLPDKLFNTLKWVALVLLLFILSNVAWQMVA